MKRALSYTANSYLVRRERETRYRLGWVGCWVAQFNRISQLTSPSPLPENLRTPFESAPLILQQSTNYKCHLANHHLQRREARIQTRSGTKLNLTKNCCTITSQATKQLLMSRMTNFLNTTLVILAVNQRSYLATKLNLKGIGQEGIRKCSKQYIQKLL